MRTKQPKPKVQREWCVASAVSKYIKTKHPRAIFHLHGGMAPQLDGKQKIMANMATKGMPDLLLFEPKGEYHGLMIELKRDGTKIFKRDGSPVSDHIALQLQILDELNAKGYKAVLCIGLQAAIEVINEYMSEV